MKPIRVLLVDDHAILRMGLASLLGTHTGIDVVGEAGNGEEGLRLALKLKPDVVLMDLMMPVMDGVEATRRLAVEAPMTKVIILTTFGTADGISHALAAGACGALMKDIKLPALVEAIQTVAGGGRALAPEIEQMMKENPPVPELSARQEEILRSVVRGLTNAEIARQLGISVPMVRDHLNVVFAKVGAANRTEAAVLALRRHLLKT